MAIDSKAYIAMLEAKVKAAEAKAAELEAKAEAKQRITVKANPAKDGKDEGTVSVYGLQRFPVSLYPSQWARLLSHADEIRKAAKLT